jgi:hypothetical protein
MTRKISESVPSFVGEAPIDENALAARRTFAGAQNSLLD